MSPTKPVFDVELITFTYGGECMGRLPDGRAVFVPFTLPGELVRVELVEEKRSYARARLLEVLKPSPQRIAPRCVHFGVCGGCHYQHVDYSHQLAAKQEILRDQFERIAGIVNPPIAEIIPSPVHWHYRNNVQFHLDPNGKLGYLAGGANTVVPIRECFLPEPSLNELWPQLDFEPLDELERVHLRRGSDDEMLLALESNDSHPPEMTVDIPLSVVHLGPAGRLIMAGEDHLVMEVLGKPFKVRADSFFQVNTPQAEAMVKYLLEVLPTEPKDLFMDVYCGVGLFSKFLASRYQRCKAIESSPSACDDFAENLDEYDHIELYIGTAEDILPRLQVEGGLAVVDPPRAGIERAALDALMEIQPQILAYVSCDPATLARDAKRLLAGGYNLVSVQPFDLFPQTYHIESISIFRPKR
jgi:23S rRNA (uracil1939-C5)-methyltransferase